jgi:hypothetical protein
MPFFIPENGPLEVLPGYTVINWKVDRVQPSLDGPMLSRRVLLKMAFEFLACHTPDSIDDQNEQLDNLRSAILKGSEAWIEVEHLTSREYRPLHGLALEEDEGHAVVHICLFGWNHYRVHLLRVRTLPPFFAYSDDLAKRTEHCAILEAKSS